LPDHVNGPTNVGAPIASGGYRTMEMVVAFVFFVVAGRDRDRCHAHAADAVLKEQHPLCCSCVERRFMIGRLALNARGGGMRRNYRATHARIYAKPQALWITWSIISTTQRYMHLSPAAIEGAIRLLESGKSVATSVATDRPRLLTRFARRL
jgi:hypothetical protein